MGFPDKRCSLLSINERAMAKPLVAIRADGGVEAGWGHLMRCLALAEQIEALGGEVLWVTRPARGGGLDRLRRRGQRIETLAEYAISDAAQTIDRLKSRGFWPHWVVVDHYALGVEWEKAIRDSGLRVLAIDDLAARDHYCDGLLDQTAGRVEADYAPWVPKDSLLLLGSDYALVGEAFRAGRVEALQRRISRAGSVDRIFISFGSHDPTNATEDAVRALEKVGYDGEVDVVLGQKAPHNEKVSRLLKALGRSYRLHLDPGDMVSLMNQADLAIGAAGVTSWERCCLALPSLLFVTADNQIDVAHALQAAGAAQLVEAPSGDRVKAASVYLSNLLTEGKRRTEMARRSALLVDGLGARRAALALFPVCTGKGGSVTLRRATKEDCDLMYRWQIRPEIRRFARNPATPDYDEHRAWFFSRLSDLRCLMHIIEYQGIPAGVIRLDASDPWEEDRGEFEVSVYVDPDLARRGIAQAALSAVRRLLPHAVFLAFVLSNNAASHRLFQACGYQWNGKCYVNRP